MKISVIIPTLNERHYLPKLLKSLFQCEEIHEIIVVDANSDDGTLAVAATCAVESPSRTKLKTLTSAKRNIGHQRNLGARNAEGDLLVFLDADIVVPSSEHWKKLMVEFVRSGCATGSCRFKPVEKSWKASFVLNFLYSFHKTMERWNPYALGACIITKKEVFEKVGGFDQSILINEDAHFVMRARKHSGFKILKSPLNISVRRFLKNGYIKEGLKYVRIFLSRTFAGEIRDNKIKYEMGNFGKPEKN